jgi:hypothetical protein
MHIEQKKALSRFIKRRNVRSYQDLIIQRHKCMERMLLAMADYMIPEKVSPHEWKPMPVICNTAHIPAVPVKLPVYTATTSQPPRKGKG